MSRRRRVVIAVSAAVVALAAGVLVLRNRATRPTSFTQGGPFRRQGAPAPSASATAPFPTPSSSPAPSPQASAGPSASPSPPPSARATQGPSRAPSPTTPPAPGAPVLAVPAEGVYTYRLEGSESVAGIFSRPFPSSATVVIHNRRQTASGTEVTLDATYIPHDHEARVIATYGPGGVVTSFEGGSIVFLGLLSQVSQSNYSPALLTNPYPSRQGWTGSSEAHDAATGAVSRTEHYQGTFVGAETVDAGGRKVDTLVYEWRSTFTGNESGSRVLRYWLEPARGLWMRWTEKIHGERGPIVYDDQATLTLQGGPQ